jgi:hypothetical protein
MAGRRPQPILAKARAVATNLDDATTSRAVDEVRAAAQTALDRRSFYIVPKVDLVVGTNAVPHSLGRAPVFVSVMPTVADATYAWAVHTNNPHPDRQVLIDVVGVAQPGASVFVS